METAIEPRAAEGIHDVDNLDFGTSALVENQTTIKWKLFRPARLRRGQGGAVTEESTRKSSRWLQPLPPGDVVRKRKNLF